MDIEETKVFIYPRMFSIHDINNDVGLPFVDSIIDNNGNENNDIDCPVAGFFLNIYLFIFIYYLFYFCFY
jgi:hypothetical protein